MIDLTQSPTYSCSSGLELNCITEVDAVIAEELNNWEAKDQKKEKQFPHELVYQKCLSKIQQLEDSSRAKINVSQPIDIKNYLKTKFLHKIDNPRLQLSKSTKSRLIFSKFLRYKKINLVITETKEAALSGKEEQRLQIIIRWLMSSTYSEELLSSLQELDLTDCRKFVIHIQSPRINISQQRYLRKLRESLNSKEISYKPKKSEIQPKVNQAEELTTTVNEMPVDFLAFNSSLLAEQTSTQLPLPLGPIKVFTDFHYAPGGKNKNIEIDEFIKDVKIPDTFENWKREETSLLELLKQSIAMSKTHLEYVQDLITNVELENPHFFDTFPDLTTASLVEILVAIQKQRGQNNNLIIS